MAKVQTLSTWDTQLCADSVEWCPTNGFTHFLAVGTYQVDKSDGETFSDDQRHGKLLLFQHDDDKSGLTLLHSVDTGAILDMKWNPSNSCPELCLVTSSGQILLYTLQEGQLKLKCHTFLSEQDQKRPVALSLDWNTRKVCSESPCIVTSDSSGGLTLLSVTNERLVTQHVFSSQHSHEAWIAAFDCWHPNIVYSGGDDCKLIQTDLRHESKVCNKKGHQAGVTSLLSDLYREHTLYTGSYDEILRQWDTRQMKEEVKSLHMEGGVWRIRQSPEQKDILATACMHNGFHLVNAADISKFICSYKEHESLAYGVDFKVDDSSSNIIIASCSFYDHQLKVWSVEL